MNASNHLVQFLHRISYGVLLVLVAAVVAVGAGRAFAEPPKLDGLFDDWKVCHTGWEETGGVGTGPFDHDIDLKQFYYKNDEKWLYLFFKSQPSLAERYRKFKYSGMVAELYFDTDRSPDTGRQKISASRSSAIREGAIRGIDVSCWVPVGVGMREWSDGRREEFYDVSYGLKVWDTRRGKLITKTRSSSLEKRSLIAHGKDGFELAIPLADLRKRPGDSFDFLCVEWAANGSDDVNRITITLD